MSDPITPDPAPSESAKATPKVPPQILDLRERPQPIRRISRTMLIGSAAAFLILMAGPGLPGDEIIVDQVGQLSRNAGESIRRRNSSYCVIDSRNMPGSGSKPMTTPRRSA